MKYALKPSTARKIKRLFAGDMSSGRRAVDDVIIEHSDLPTLYTVVYSAALESWLIYLADDALNVNGAAVDVIGDLEEAGDPYPDGYYILSALDPESGGTVYLNISSGEAEFSDEADESADYAIKVATATVDDETGRRTVSQLITSAIVIGGSKIPGPFEPVFKADENRDLLLDDVGPGWYPHGRDFYSEVTVDSSAKKKNAMLGIEITHASAAYAGSTPSAIIKSINAVGNDIINSGDTTKTVIPLYGFANGRITLDCRCLMALALRQ